MALIQCNFFSRTLMRPVPIHVILPTDKMMFPGMAKPEETPFKTLYLLHGIFGNYTDWVSGTRIQSWAQDKNLAVVMPSADNAFYVDNPKSNALYGSFIHEELVEFTRKSFPLSRKREDTFIGGLSMGGYGSIVNALQAPETFGAVCALSSALVLDKAAGMKEYTDFLMTNKGYYESVFGNLDELKGSDKDYDALAEKLAKSGEPKPRFYMACGTEDDLIGGNRDFRDHLKALNFDVTWEEAPGKHDWEFWDTYIKKVLDWLPLGEEQKGVSSGNVSQ